MNEVVKFHNMSFMNLIKVVGSYFNLKGIANHSNIPSFDLKVVFHASMGSIGTW